MSFGLNQDGLDERMDQDLVLNQDLKDSRIDHDYDQMLLEIPRYCRGISNTHAPYKHGFISFSD